MCAGRCIVIYRLFFPSTVIKGNNRQNEENPGIDDRGDDSEATRCDEDLQCFRLDDIFNIFL